MVSRDIAIVFDCGATNIRALATDRAGNIVASASVPNATRPDPSDPSYLIWDMDEIMEKICSVSRRVMSVTDPQRLAGVTVTTFGVDGTIFSRDGRMLHPVISWQCGRTEKTMRNISRYIDAGELYAISGVCPFAFNTLFRIIWLRENRPDLLDRAHAFLFVPSVISHRLTGVMVNDITMAGTSMMTELKKRSWSPVIIKAAGITAGLMGDPVEPGTVTGMVTQNASVLTGLPEGLPVVATGHDTQYAIFGSGAGLNVPVLSSGTWEILMARSASAVCGKEEMAAGITCELDSRPGVYNIGNQWIASGLIEWVKKKYYPVGRDDVYDLMFQGALEAPVSCNGVKVKTDFTGTDLSGCIEGLAPDTKPGEIVRALLTALAEKLRQGKEALEKAGSFNASRIICVGGGSRSSLWNQMRADATGAVIEAAEIPEATALGASCFVQYAAGNASSPEEAVSAIEIKRKKYIPDAHSGITAGV